MYYCTFSIQFKIINKYIWLHTVISLWAWLLTLSRTQLCHHFKPRIVHIRQSLLVCPMEQPYALFTSTDLSPTNLQMWR